MIGTSASPSARAASTNSFSFRVRTEPRITRANCGTRKMALAMITLPRPVPRAAMMARARKIPGNAIMMSTIRMISMSGQRPTYPATTPSAVPSTRASPASATKSATTRPPLMAARLLRMRRRASLQNPGERPRRLGARSVVVDTGIEVGIRDVGDEVDQDEGGGDDQECALHHGIVPREDALHDEAADPRQREDRLGEHGAAEVVAELETEDGQDGDHRVPQSVPVHDEPIRQPLGARRPDIILPQDL